MIDIIKEIAVATLRATFIYLLFFLFNSNPNILEWWWLTKILYVIMFFGTYANDKKTN